MSDREFNLQDEERERMQQFELYRKLCVSILLKWWWAVLLLMVVTAMALTVFFEVKFWGSQERYEAATGLFFFPKEVKSFYAPMSQKQTMELFERSTLLKQVADRLNLSPKERASLAGRIEITSDKNRPNLIQIAVKAHTLEGAVLLANAVADVCCDEYVEFRSRDLRSRLDTMLDRKAELERSLDRAEKQQRELVSTWTALSPLQEVDRLRVVISVGLAKLSELNIQYSNEDARRKKLEELLSKIDSNGLKYADRLRELLENQERLKKETYRLRQLYTDKNPRLQAIVAEYEDAVREYEDFVKEKQIRTRDPESLRNADAMLKELSATTESLENLKQNRTALNSEIEKNRETVAQLTAMLPKYDEYVTQRQSLFEILNSVEEGIGDIQLLLAMTPNDLQQVEKVTGATRCSAFDKKAIALIMAGTVVVTGTGVILLIVLSILFGKVSTLEEISANRNLVAVGSYPASEKQFSSAQEKEAVLHGIYYKYREVLGSGHVLFEGVGQGGRMVPDILEALEWNSAMAGLKVVRINIVSAVDFKVPEDCEDHSDLVAVQCAGTEGFLPVGNLHALSPAELEMLGSDVKTLLKKYDVLVLARSAPLQAPELFYRQMVAFCDCSLLYFGAGATSRRLLRYTAGLPRSCGRTVAVILTGVKRLTPADAR